MAIGLSRKHVLVAERFRLLSGTLRQYLFVAALLSTTGASALYASLLSMHYIGDGIRWYPDIVYSARPMAGGANHLTYPLLQWLWYHLLLTLGLSGTSITATVGHLQALNALLAGLGLTLFWALLKEVTDDGVASTLGTVLLGLSYAYSTHATDMTEVMPSFPPTIGALLLAVRSWHRRSSVWIAVGAGCLLAVGTSLYQNAILAAPAVAIAFAMRGTRWNDNRLRRKVWRALGTRVTDRAVWVFAGVTALASALIYSAVIGTMVTRRPAAIVSYLADAPGQGTFGSFNPLHFIALAFGWANAQFGLMGWAGGSRLLSGSRVHLVYNLGIVLATFFAAGIVLWSGRQLLQSRRTAAGLTIFALWFAFPALFAGYWVNTYTKLWVQPMAAWAGVLAITAAARARHGAVGPTQRHLSAVRLLLLAYVVAVGTINVGFHIFPLHFRPNPSLGEAEHLGQIVRPRDLLIAEGWDDVGVDFAAFVKRPFISYVDTAFRFKLQNGPLVAYLERRVRETQEHQGTVYSIALLDKSLSQWQPYLEQHLHLDYGALSTLRSLAYPLRQRHNASEPEPVMVLRSLVGNHR